MGKGLEMSIIIEFLIYSSAVLVPMALPLAVLLSSIMVMGTLGENVELTAMKSAGISLVKIMKPLIYTIIGVSIFAFLFSNYVWPVAYLKQRALLFDLSDKKPAFQLKDNVFYSGIEDFRIRVKSVNNKTNELTDVLIYDHTDKKAPGNRKVIRAKSGNMESINGGKMLVLTLFNGNSYEESDNRKDQKYSLTRNTFTTQILRFDMSSFDLTRSDDDFFKGSYQMYSLRQLNHIHDSLSNRRIARKANFDRNIKSEFFMFRDSTDVAFSDEQIKASRNKYAVFDSLPYKDQKQILEIAINNSRNQKGRAEQTIQELNTRKQYINLHKIEWHRKFTLAFACLVLFFIGAPLGAITKKGGLGLPFVSSVILFLVFHIISTTGEKMAKQGVMEPFFGMWLSSLVLLPLGIFLTYKALSDSSLLDFQSYTNSIKRLFGLLKKKKIDTN